MGLGGCIEVSGGAVEARWDLRDRLGVRIACSEAGLAEIGIALQPLGEEAGTDPCVEKVSCRFPCSDAHGTTGFAIADGQYSISLYGVSAAGDRLGPEQGVTTPAPVVRNVRTGELTDLNVNLIIVNQ